MADFVFGEETTNNNNNNFAATTNQHEDPFGEPGSTGSNNNNGNKDRFIATTNNNDDDGGFGFGSGNAGFNNNNNNNKEGSTSSNNGTPKTNQQQQQQQPAGGETLPVSKNVKTQDQLMAESIDAITARGAKKYQELQEAVRKRTQDIDAKSTAGVQKLESDAAAELKAHSRARDETVAAAKKTHAADQEKLLKEMGNLEKKGTVWELASTHCDLSKPNSRATKSTDKMRKTLTTLVTEPNVPIGAPGSH